MKVMLNRDKKPTIHQVDLKGNEILVERAGYVPLKTQVDRAFSAGAIAQMRAKMADPNGQYDRIIEDATAVEENFKDNLTLLRFAKEVKMNCLNALEAQKQAQNAQMQADKAELAEHRRKSAQKAPEGPEGTI